MTITIILEDEEGFRKIEDDDENIKSAYVFIINKLEDFCAEKQIRYKEITCKPFDVSYWID